MIIHVYAYNGTSFVLRGTLQDAMTSCTIKRDADTLANEMNLTCLESGKYTRYVIPGNILQSEEKLSNMYVITEVKSTEKTRTAVAEEICHFILRNCIALPRTPQSMSPSSLVSNMLHYYAYPNLYDNNLLEISIPIRTFPQNIYRCVINEPKRFVDFLKGSEGSIADISGGIVKLSSENLSTTIRITIDVSPYSDTVVEHIAAGREIFDTTITSRLDPKIPYIIPYWKGTENDEETVYVGAGIRIPAGSYFLGMGIAALLDCSSSFSVKPALDALNQKAVSYGSALKREPSYSIKITDKNVYGGYGASFSPKQITRAINVDIGDLVKIHLFTGEDITARVVATEYDCIEEKYTSIIIGEKLNKFSGMLAKDIKR